MSRSGSATIFLALGSLLQLGAQQTSKATLEIHFDKPTAKVSPLLYGLMTEEINYSYDGGLYGELVRNRTLHDSNWDIPAWFVVEGRDSAASMEIDRGTGPSAALPLSLKLKVDRASLASRAGLKNTGYWGVPIRANSSYQCSFYAKASDASGSAITVSIRSDQSGMDAATATIPSLNTEWKQYKVVLKTGSLAPSSNNHLILAAEHPGTFWFNLVSLFPPTYHARANGNRIDLMEKMAAMRPAFLRFPGGNYLEGDHLRERYEWKKTIGPLCRPAYSSESVALPLLRWNGVAGVSGMV